MIDYTSMVGLKEKRRRFSEDVVDMDLKDSDRINKLFRQIQKCSLWPRDQGKNHCPLFKFKKWLLYYD